MAGGLRLTLVVLTTTLVGCSLFTSLRGLDDGDGAPLEVVDGAASGERDVAGPSSDGSSIDETSVVVDAGDDGASGESLPNGGFESGSCSTPWMFNPGTTSTEISKDARSGTYSCRICNIGAPMGGFGLFVTFATDEWGPGKYTLDAYVRSDSDGLPALGTAQLTVRGAGPARYPSANNPSSGSAWVRVRVVVEVGAGEHLAAALVGGYSDEVGSCLLVDDVTLVRE